MMLPCECVFPNATPTASPLALFSDGAHDRTGALDCTGLTVVFRAENRPRLVLSHVDVLALLSTGVAVSRRAPGSASVDHRRRLRCDRRRRRSSRVKFGRSHRLNFDRILLLYQHDTVGLRCHYPLWQHRRHSVG